MAESEHLREALLELNVLREQEAAALREANALVDALSCVTQSKTPRLALEALLLSVQETFACHATALLAQGSDGARIEMASRPHFKGRISGARELLDPKARRIVDVRDKPWWTDGLAAELGDIRAVLSAPVVLDDQQAMALVCFSLERAAFSVADLRLLVNLTGIAAQSLSSLAISEHNALLAAVIEGSAASVSIADAGQADMPLIYVNRAFEALTGYAKAEVLGSNCRLLSAEAPESPERLRLRNAIKNRVEGTFELQNRRKDGTFFWNHLSLYPIKGDTGEIAYMVATQVDASERRAIEEERDQARSRLVNALSSTSEGFLLVDPAGRIAFANNCYRNFFNDEEGWQPGESFVEIWARRLQRDGVEAGAALKAARDRQQELFAGRQDAEVQLEDGRIVLLNDQPTADGGAVSIATDVTSLKATERMLTERAVAIDAAQDAIAITDLSGRFVYMNPSHMAMFGYEREAEVLGKPWTMLYEPEQADYMQRVAMPELERIGTWRGEVPGLSRDGARVVQEISLTLLHDIGLICVTRDIAERQRSERERARLVEQLNAAQRREAIGQMAAGIAHDFNNLLAAVTGSATLLLESVEEPGKVRTHAERILTAGARATAMVSRLLDMGAHPSQPQMMDLREAFSEGAEVLRASGSRRASYSISQAQDPLIAKVDPTDVLQVVLNLAINARDALGDAPGEVRLDLRAADADSLRTACRLGEINATQSYAILTVADTGKGMNDEELEKVFEPYYTTKGRGGTGLGLAVVSSIIQAIGGALNVTSHPGRGTEFRVFWPLNAPKPAKPETAQPTTRKNLDGKTVIIVDDDAAVADVIAALLESSGAEVAVCENPLDALAAIEEDPNEWDLLVTDYDMPVLPGPELARRVRAVVPEIPILLCTALAGKKRDDGTSKTLFDGILGKPVSKNSLISAALAAMSDCNEKRGGP
ncbi:MAG: PAS domain S-box protein [Kiloniellales bacterium]